MADQDGAEDAPFHDVVELLGWIALHCGLDDARTFARLPHGEERALMVAACAAAERRRVDELEEFAGVVARLMGGGK